MNSLNHRIFNTILLSALSAILFILPIKTSANAPVSVTEERTVITQFAADSHYSIRSSSTGRTGYGSSLSVPESANSFSYTSDHITPEQNVNALGVLLSGSFNHNHTGAHPVQIIAHVQGAESAYSIELPIMHGDQKGAASGSTLSTSPVVLSDVESYVLEVNLFKNGSNHSVRIDSLEVVGMNVGELELREAGRFAAATDALTIISREDWGADESYRFVTASDEETGEDSEENTSETNDEAGEEVWPVQLQDKEVFIVHHTAGTDGGSDPSASVRAIYYWHAIVLGWGDIGYNYLIDPDGNIYKGRYGGVQAKGAHAYNSVDLLDYNENTVGIALLGCFEETEGACTTVHTTTEEMDAALAELIGTKAAELGIDPDSTTTLFEEELERVVGHRDVDYTYCPGSGVHADLAGVRSAASAVYDDAYIIPLQATYTAATTMNLDDEGEATEEIGKKKLTYGDEHQITISYENTGTENWTQEELKLKAFHRNKKNISPMRHESWNGKWGGIQMNEETVAPGETATFTFLIHSPKKPGNKQLFTKLYHDGEKVKKSNAATKLKFTSVYEGSVTLDYAPIAVFADDTHTIEFTLTNSGETDWPEDELAMYSNGSILESVDVPSLAAGESATLTFDWTAPDEETIYYLRARVKQNGYRLPGTRFATGILVHEQ